MVVRAAWGAGRRVEANERECDCRTRETRLTTQRGASTPPLSVRGTAAVGWMIWRRRRRRRTCRRRRPLEDDLEVPYYTRENSQKEIRARESTQHSWLGGNTLQISARVDQMDCSPRVHSDDDGGRGRQCSFTVSTSARFKAAKEVATLGGKYRGNPAIKGQFSLQASQTHWNP